MVRRIVVTAALLVAAVAPALAQEVEERASAATPYPWPECRVVPAIGRTLTDALGRRWQTDLDLTNVGEAPTRVSLALLFRGEDNTLAPRAILAPIAPGASLHLDDVVVVVLERLWQSVLGGLVICSESSRVEAVSRTAWYLPDAGSVGQAVPALAFGETVSSDRVAHLLGLREDARFRTHLGILNPNDSPVTARIRLIAPDGTVEVTLLHQVAPLSQLQLNRVLAPYGLEAARAEIRSDGGSLFSYATRIDNASNDSAWIQPRRGE
jgi:hypothetical protein